MKRRRVKITGIGPVTPAGIGREDFWRGIMEPVSRVRAFPKLDDEYGPFVAAYIDDSELKRYVDLHNMPKRAARHTLFAVTGALLAMKDACISRDEVNSYCSAIVTGTSIMDFGGIVSSMDSVAQKGARGAKPWLIYNVGHGCVANAIVDVLQITARTMAISNQCCSGMDALAYGSSLVASGEVEIAICGGTEAPLHRSPLVEFRAAGLTPATTEMADRLARPFDLWRTTGVIGEGACMFVVEPEDSPRKGYSYIDGYGSASDIAENLCSGLVASGKFASAAAGCSISELDVISAWGPGHKLIDKGEARAMRTLFGEDVDAVPTSSIKAAIGTPLGAAPAIQIASAAIGQRYGIIPPTAGWKYADPDCALRLSSQPMFFAHELTLVNSHGMGAVNSSMILRRC